MFRSAVNSLPLRGRLVEIAVTGQREVSFDLADFYHNERRLFGVDTLKRDLTASAQVLDVLTPGFVAGDYRAAPIAETCGLCRAQVAYRKVAAGAAGRVLLWPQESGRVRGRYAVSFWTTPSRRAWRSGSSSSVFAVPSKATRPFTST
jgi:NADPH2:quinone reductase